MGAKAASVKVLVTGGGGFLGGAIVRLLRERGDEVRVLGRGEYPGLVAAGVDVRRGDVADAGTVDAAVMGVDAVVHTAAKVGSWGRAEDFLRTNVRGTQNVIEACRKAGVSRLVFTSSPSVAHGGGDVEGIAENHPYPEHYDADYPRTKAAAERAVLAANGSGLLTVALRPHLVWGPGDTQLLPRAIARARTGRLRLPGGPDKLIDCTYVANAARAHVLALDCLARPGAPCAGRAYFISQGEPLPIREVLRRVLGAAGVPVPTRTVPPWLMQAMGAVAERAYATLGIWDREPPITRFVARQLTTAHWFDTTAARRDLGYEPAVSFAQGLRLLAQSLQGARP